MGEENNNMNPNRRDQNPNGGGSNGGNNNKRNNRAALIICLVCSVIMLIGWVSISNEIKARTQEEITYDEFITLLNEDKLEKVEIYADSGKLVVTPKNQPYSEQYTLTYFTGLLEDGNEIQQRCEAAGVSYTRVL